MAQITKSIHAQHRLMANLLPPSTLAKISQSELEDRLAHVAELTVKADRATDHVVAGCYRSVAKAALAARPRDEVEQEVRALRARAELLGPGHGDIHLRRADELLTQNPVAPRRTSVRKAQAGTSLVPVYDCNGKLTGVVDEAELIPVTDAEIVAKAARRGMTAVYGDRGDLTGFADPKAIIPVVNETVRAGGTTGLGRPRQAAQQRLPGDVPDRTVIKAAGRAGAAAGKQARESAAGVPDGRVAAYTQDGRFVGYVRPQYIEDPANAKFPAGTPDAERPSAGPGRIDLTARQVVKAALPPVRTATGRVALLRDLPPRSARRGGSANA